MLKRCDGSHIPGRAHHAEHDEDTRECRAGERGRAARGGEEEGGGGEVERGEGDE
jgi:hypothetical protein